MSKRIRLMIVAVAAVCLFASFATSAYAYSGFYVPCGACHATAAAGSVSAVESANDGITATYTVTASGTEWAAFAGYTKIASGAAPGGTLVVPAGADYTIYAVGGSPTAGTYAATTVSPGSTAIDAIDYSADVAAPVSTSDAVATYSGSATIEITATDDSTYGVQYIYYSLNGGTVRTTPIGTSGSAVVYVRPTSSGTTNYTLEFWAQDRAGNLEDPPVSASFDVTRDAAAATSAGIPLTTLGPNGMSQWTYQDLADASAKYEGGYAAYGGISGYYADPHGGYDTSTNKCKVCHAVHRAEGAYYLLRADSQDDACDYCHIGGSAHSSLIVYDLNSAGKATTNGHTIGASTYIPDSTVSQWTESVTLETVDADGNPLSEQIEVRAYDEEKNDMYRFARHHGHSEANGGARRNYLAVGPLALRCMSCHQVHNAEAQTWMAQDADQMGYAGEYLADAVDSYKLLKQFPSGTFTSSDTTTVPDIYGQVPLNAISLVPETTLTAGVNFDDVRAMGAAPTALNLVRGGTSRAYNKPLWVAQGFDGEHDPAAPLAEEAIASSVNNAALSVWCADCHNLNIGGWEHLTNEELGFKSHTERTHPAPYTGAHSGPGQCYSCHRNDLPRINSGDSCSQCHYGTGNYVENRRVSSAEYVASDFPHSGEDGDFKMLGSYSIVPIANYGDSATTIDETVTVGPTNLDAVCIRCHGGIGTYH